MGPNKYPLYKVYMGLIIKGIHQKLNGTESQRTPDQVSCETELLDSQEFSGSVKRGSCWRFLGNLDFFTLYHYHHFSPPFGRICFT